VIARFLARRALLSLVTLAILSVIVFLGGQLLPGDVGRAVLGHWLTRARWPCSTIRWGSTGRSPFNTGLDHPLFRGRHGPIVHVSRTRRAVHRPGAGQFPEARGPGVRARGAARYRRRSVGRASGRSMERPALVLLGQSLGVVPEFISSIVLILVFGVWLHWLPMSADWPEGAGR